MPEPTYGGKCHRCGCLRHDGEHASEPISWLSRPPERLLWCADCDFCQRHSLSTLIAEAGLGIFDPEVRQAVHAFERGDDHPLIDRLRDECQAITADGQTGHDPEQYGNPEDGS